MSPIRRIHAPHVQPLEVWDLMVQGRSLYSWQDDPCFCERLVEGLERWRAGTATFEAGPTAPRQAGVAFDSVYLTGAGVNRPGLREALAGAGHVVTVDPEPAFPGCQGAVALAGDAQVLGVDLGQTGVKAWQGRHRVRRVRDWSELPLRTAGLPEAALQEGYERLLALIVAAIRALPLAPPRTAVLALPTQVSDDGAVAGCTYPYSSPHRTFLADLTLRAGLADTAWQVLNDAELAAHSAAVQLGPERTGSVLVLTFGFGVGAALLTRGAQAL